MTRARTSAREWHRVGFNEQDKPMIEAARRQMGGTDLMAMKPMPLSIDVAAARARRVMASLRAREARGRSDAAE